MKEEQKRCNILKGVICVCVVVLKRVFQGKIEGRNQKRGGNGFGLFFSLGGRRKRECAPCVSLMLLVNDLMHRGGPSVLNRETFE